MPCSVRKDGLCVCVFVVEQCSLFDSTLRYAAILDNSQALRDKCDGKKPWILDADPAGSSYIWDRVADTDEELPGGTLL